MKLFYFLSLLLVGPLKNVGQTVKTVAPPATSSTYGVLKSGVGKDLNIICGTILPGIYLFTSKPVFDSLRPKLVLKGDYILKEGDTAYVFVPRTALGRFITSNWLYRNTVRRFSIGYSSTKKRIDRNTYLLKH